MSWSWVVRMLIILVVVLIVVAGTAVALRLTDPGTDEIAEATPAPQDEMVETPTPLVTPFPTLTPSTPIPTPPPPPTPAAEATPLPTLAAGDPCTSELSAAIAAANQAQIAFMRGEIQAAQLSASWGAMAERAQSSAASLLAKQTDTYSVNRITAVDPQVNDCNLQSVSADGNQVVVETEEVWTYDAVLNCTAAENEQTSREVVTYPGQQYTFVRQGDAWRMENWIIGVVNIAPAWQCS